MSEDCLALNVWSRANTSADKLSVMFWIYGGALVVGSGVIMMEPRLLRRAQW